MSSCRICGRALSNPASIAAGVGPVCGSRNYSGRIRSRFGSSLGGWTDIEAWEKVNKPCYSCKNFEIPAKGQEQEIPYSTGFKVSMHGEEKIFHRFSIGGWCKALRKLVDGNLIDKEIVCDGEFFYPRKKEEQQPEVGLLIGRDGQTELFKI